jgi:hypothetical protein
MVETIDHHRRERATVICNELFRKEKIFICPNKSTYEKLVYLIKYMQEAPASGLKAEVANLKKVQETSRLTKEERYKIYQYDTWEQTREMFKILIGKAKDGGFINDTNSFIREVDQLRSVYLLIVDFILSTLFNGYTHIAFLHEGNNKYNDRLYYYFFIIFFNPFDSNFVI